MILGEIERSHGNEDSARVELRSCVERNVPRQYVLGAFEYLPAFHIRACKLQLREGDPW